MLKIKNPHISVRVNRAEWIKYLSDYHHLVFSKQGNSKVEVEGFVNSQ